MLTHLTQRTTAMLSFLKRMIVQSEPENLKQYSLTTTPASEGSDCKADLHSDIRTILTKIKYNESINNQELNKLNEFYFNKPNIPAGVFTLNKDFVNGMVFEIKRIDTVNDINGDIDNIYITLSEMTLSNEMSLTISVKDFHEIFQHFQLTSRLKDNPNAN